MQDIAAQRQFEKTISDTRFVRCMEAIARGTNRLISFDLFDTLVIRNVLVPTDLFHYLNEDARRIARTSTLNFATQRIKAEKTVRHRLQIAGLMEDPSLEVIYNEFAEQTNASQAIIDDLVQMEISAEISFCHARKPVQALVHYAMQQAKPVIICTDTYLPSAAIKSLIVKTGYPASLPIFVSNEIGCTKKHGTMFSYIARELGFAAEEILHIGDNANSDVRQAEAAGWKALRVAAPTDQLLKVEKGFPRLFPAFETKKHLPEGAPRYNVGLIVSRSANRQERCIDPILLDDGIPYDFGYAALGPFVLSLCLWMLRQSQENGVDHLFFLARDGYLPLRIARRLKEALGYGPELSYLPISRMALLPYMLSRPGGIDAALNVALDTKKLLSEFVRERFGETAWQIVHDTLSEIAPLNPFATAHDYLDAIAGILKKKAPAVIESRQTEIDNLVRYYKSRLAPGVRNAVFDVGRKGTFQAILSEISGATVYGFYVVTDNAIDSNIPGRNYSSFLGAIDQNIRAKNPDTVLYEVFLSERAGTVTGFSAFLEPLRSESHESEREREFFEKLHAGAIKFAEDAIAQHQSRIYRLEQPAYYAALAIERCMEPSGSRELLAAIRHEDSLTTSTPRTLMHYFGPRVVEPEDGWLVFPPKGEYRRVALYCPAMTRIRGGAERVAARLCHHFAAEGYEILVISSGRETHSTTPVYPLPPGVFVRNVDPRNVKRLSALLGAFQADAGLILASGSIVIPISLAYLQHGIPYLLSERAAPRASFENYWQGFAWDDYVATHEAASLIGLQFPSFIEEYPAHFHGRIWTLPNPIEVPPARTEAQEKLIACVGRLFLKQKQQHLLIEAFSHVVSDYPDWTLELYGEAYGEDRTFLENLVATHKLEERVKIFNPIAHIDTVYQRASIFAFPSNFEGFPNALAEALSHGLPSVGFAGCPGTNQLICDGQNGLLVADHYFTIQGNTASLPTSMLIKGLETALRRLMGDEVLRASLSSGARESMHRYTEEVALSVWSQCLQALLQTDGRLMQKHRLQFLASMLARMAGTGTAPKAAASKSTTVPKSAHKPVAAPTATAPKAAASKSTTAPKPAHKPVAAPVTEVVPQQRRDNSTHNLLLDKLNKRFNSGQLISITRQEEKYSTTPKHLLRNLFRRRDSELASYVTFRTWVDQGDAARDAKKWDLAAVAYCAALNIDPCRHDIWVQYGHALKEDGALNEAAQAYEYASRLAPHDPDPILHLAHLLKRQDVKRALATFEKLQTLSNDRSVLAEIATLRAGS